MPLDIHWDNDEKTVMLMTYSEDWTWEDLFEAQAIAHHMAGEVDHPFDVIHDLRTTVRLPPNVFSNIRILMTNMPLQNRANVFVGMRPFVRTIWNSFTMVYSAMMRGKKYYFAETPNHARILLEDAYQAQR